LRQRTQRPPSGGLFVFPANSESGHVEEPKDAFAEIEKITGIKVSPHDLRRTFETVAESCDISPFGLKALINHRMPHQSQTDVTAGYVIMSTERLREVAQKLADKLRALCAIPAPQGENVTALPR
jgi:integrase